MDLDKMKALALAAKNTHQSERNAALRAAPAGQHSITPMGDA